MPARPSSLRTIDAFKGLPAATLRRLESACQWHEVASRQPILCYRARERTVCFMVHGSAIALLQTVSGRTVEFGAIRQGQMFGELAAIDKQPRALSVMAETDCIVAHLDGTFFHKLLEDEPQVMHAVLRHLAARVRGLTTRIYELSVLAVPVRLQAELLRMARSGDVNGDTAVVRRLPTHTELASRIATAREVVSREIGRLDQQGLVERRGTSLRVPSLARLEMAVREAFGELEIGTRKPPRSPPRKSGAGASKSRRRTAKGSGAGQGRRRRKQR